MCSVLAGMGFTVQAHASGAAGLRTAGKALITLNTDNLPDLNALEAAKGIRTISRAPLLALTSWRAPDDHLTGLDAIADAYLIKPLSADQFKELAQALYLKASPGTDAR